MLLYKLEAWIKILNLWWEIQKRVSACWALRPPFCLTSIRLSSCHEWKSANDHSVAWLEGEGAKSKHGGWTGAREAILLLTRHPRFVSEATENGTKNKRRQFLKSVHSWWELICNHFCGYDERKWFYKWLELQARSVCSHSFFVCCK